MASGEITYYRDFDSDLIYACVGPMASEALFVLRDPRTAGGQWEFLVPESPAWDATHQGIFRNHRAQVVRPDEIAGRLPPLPEIPRGAFPEWKEYFLPKKPLSASKHPAVARFVAESGQQSVTVFVILFEDGYESAFGDGEFHYFRDVFLDRADAERAMAHPSNEWERFHLREMRIQLDGGAFAFPDFDVQRYDRYNVDEALSALEALLGARAG